MEFFFNLISDFLIYRNYLVIHLIAVCIYFYFLLLVFIIFNIQGPNSAITYVLSGNEEAADYFEIGYESGEVRLSQSLVETTIEEFEVSKIDNGVIDSFQLL